MVAENVYFDESYDRLLSNFELKLCKFIPLAPSAPPRNVMPTITSRSITVTWDTITCIERNGIITNYTAEFGPSGNPTIRTWITELTFTANGLTPFTNYTFRVAGVNSVNTGIYSDIITVVTFEEG